ncbi:uncharacterized protein LOC122859356 isoform X2 [Aphidius gifuensis]|nr:uncharacterized protein LOC122859356 isoform X2 [Aphidius gifuensis]
MTMALVTDNNTIMESVVKEKILSRQKRYLTFPEGSNLQLVYCLTIGTFPRPADMVVGMTIALAWQLPSKIDKKITTLLHRQSRSIAFPKIEAFLQSIGLDGKSCVMRALCEAGQRKDTDVGKGTFIQELLHSIFRLRNDGTKFEKQKHKIYDYVHNLKNNNCAEEYPTCQHSIYELDF